MNFAAGDLSLLLTARTFYLQVFKEGAAPQTEGLAPGRNALLRLERERKRLGVARGLARHL